MSAYIVSKRHIDAMVGAGLSASPYGELRWRHRDEWHELSHENATEVGAMLWAENETSVSYRYSPPGREYYYGEHAAEMEPLEELPGGRVSEEIAPGVVVEMPEWAEPYRYSAIHPLPAVAVLKAIDCYEYQSCEHPEWEESEAFAFCDSLRRSLIGSLPGYDQAAWSIA